MTFERNPETRNFLHNIHLPFVISKFKLFALDSLLYLMADKLPMARYSDVWSNQTIRKRHTLPIHQSKHGTTSG